MSEKEYNAEEILADAISSGKSYALLVRKGENISFDGRSKEGLPGIDSITTLYYDEKKKKAGNRTYRVKYSNCGRVFVLDESITDEEGLAIIRDRYNLRGEVV